MPREGGRDDWVTVSPFVGVLLPAVAFFAFHGHARLFPAQGAALGYSGQVVGMARPWQLCAAPALRKLPASTCRPHTSRVGGYFTE